MQQVEAHGVDIVQYRSLNDQHRYSQRFLNITILLTLNFARLTRNLGIDLTQVHPPTALWKLSRAFGEGLGFRALCFCVAFFGMGLLENSVLCCRGLMAQLLQLPFSFRVAVVGMPSTSVQTSCSWFSIFLLRKGIQGFGSSYWCS